MNIWFTADLHLGHRFVSGLRGFDTVQEHDETIIKNWHDRVHFDDQIWVLGDIACSNPSDALAQIKKLPGRKHLIAGNHDRCHPMHRNAHKHQFEYLQVFESLQSMARRRISGQVAMLSHFPYSTDRTSELRCTQYRLPDEGRWLLHGHTHSSAARTSSREIHVGLDAWELAPVQMSVIEKMINHDLLG